MNKLSQQEMECLRKLSSQGGQAASPGDKYILDALIVSGLVERVKVTALPLEYPAYIYRLTAAGWRQCDNAKKS